MKSRKPNLFVLAAFFLGLITLAMPVVSFGQDDESIYTRRYSRRDVATIIANLEQSSNTFKTDFDNYVNDRSVSGSDRNRLKRIVSNYENALDRLRRNFDSSDNWWRSRNNVQSVMDEANQVNNMMNSLAFARRLERQWNQMRRDINRLAETYNLPQLGNWNNGGGGGGGGGNVPTWAVGSFYGRNPQTGGVIAMNISRNGRVTITFEDGATVYASMNGTNLNNGGIVSRVTRINNGIRTTRTDTGERIDYFVNNPGGGGGGDWDNGGGGGGNIPTWAVGSFYGRNPQTGGTISMTIRRNGNVTITFEDGATVYATMNGTTLNNGGITSRVTRTNNGIRTTRNDTGERIDYRRN